MNVVEEFETVKTIKETGASIARYGDGELRCAVGNSACFQKSDPVMAKMLKKILREDVPGLLVGIPRIAGPKAHLWEKIMAKPSFAEMLNPKHQYYSAFITRPDSAPQIDTGEYWTMCKSLWEDRNVVMVEGTAKRFSKGKNVFDNAKSVTIISGPSKDAFVELDRLTKKVLVHDPDDCVVILSLGPTATILAYQLHKHGYQALDMGHWSSFYNRAHPKSKIKGVGMVITDYHRDQNRQLHRKDYGGSGYKWSKFVYDLIVGYKLKGWLDYGCGQSTLYKEFKKFHKKCKVGYIEYDPAIPKKSWLPISRELVSCTDVLEHIEPELLDNVLTHIFQLAKKVVFLVIALNPANKEYPDGRNTHLILESPAWWVEKLARPGWRMRRFKAERTEKDLVIVMVKE